MFEIALELKYKISSTLCQNKVIGLKSVNVICQAKHYEKINTSCYKFVFFDTVEIS